MTGTFILYVSENRYLNQLLIPCFATKQIDKDFFTMQEIINQQHTAYKNNILSKPQKDIIDAITCYEDKNLSKVYNRKKVPFKKFLESIDEKLLNETIRPFIETCIVKCLKIAIDNNIPLYISKNNNTNFFADDKVTFLETIPEITFNFEKTTDGLQYTQSLLVNNKELTLYGKPYILLSKTPCRIIINQQLFQFDDIDGAKLLPFFTKKHIAIPARMEQTYFETFILKTISKFKVKAKGFTIQDVREHPFFVFKVVKNLSGEKCFFLSIKYADKLFDHHRKTAFTVDYYCIDQEHQYRKIYRDFDAETAFCNSLLNLGLHIDNHGFFMVDEPLSLYQWITTNAHFFNQPQCSFLFENESSITTQIPDIQTDVVTNNDWFDIKSYVVIGSIKLPFVAFKKHILARNCEFIIDESTIFIIPEEWFSRYVDVFVYGQQNGENITIKKHHFVSVDSLNHYAVKQIADDLRKHQRNSTVPQGLKANLRPYQLQGYQWLCSLMHHGLGGCLADDMGLGKTLQAIALLVKIAESNTEKINSEPKKQNTVYQQLSLFDEPIISLKKNICRKTSVIIMPASLIHNWFNEFRKFAPSLHVLKFVGAERISSASHFSSFDVVLTTYGYARNNIDMFSTFQFHYIILDESQMIKNPYSKTYESLCKLQSTHKLVLTGTPIENRLLDLWSQMNFINQGMLGNIRFFKDTYVDKIESNNQYIVENLKNIINPFLLRRLKQDVLTELPEKQEQVVFCKMSASQEKIYEQEKSKIRNEILDTLKDEAIAKKMSANVLQAMLRLRQIANHPAMCHLESEDGSGKFEEITRSIENVIDEGHKVLIFSSFVSHLDLLKEYLEATNVKYAYLTGASRDRETIVSTFQNDASIPVFLISLKAGGIGLNLTQADYVFIIDPWWNPAVEEQAISRSHRMGQENKVFVYRFITENSIEEKIQNLQSKKNKLALLIDNQDTINMSNETILYLLD